MTGLTERRQHALTGAIAILVLVAGFTVGIKGAFGAFEGGYELVGSFDAAGQGLLPGSDVKIRGVNVGEVKSINLVDGAARIRLRINDGEQIPESASATIRPKTLFGEKFVDIDPGADEQSGPHLEDGGEILDTAGGFELEQVLGDIYPLLQAVDTAELTTILDELATGGDGLGETINRSIVNSEELGALFADNADLTSRFLADLADLSDQLADSAEDVLGVADAANDALPTLIDNEAALIDLLQQAGRLSNDVSDLLEGNPEFVSALLGDGSRTLNLLHDRRDQVIPLVIGLRQYLQVFATTVRIDVGNDSLMAAVKIVLGGEACTLISCPGTAATDLAPSGGGSAPGVPEIPPTVGTDGVPAPANPIEELEKEVSNGLEALLRKVLGA